MDSPLWPVTIHNLVAVVGSLLQVLRKRSLGKEADHKPDRSGPGRGYRTPDALNSGEEKTRPARLLKGETTRERRFEYS